MPRGLAYRKLTNNLREVLAAHAEAGARQMPVDEVSGERAERKLLATTVNKEKRGMEEARGWVTRREFLWKATAVSLREQQSLDR